MFERLIFERIETRVMVGITMFVAVMLIVGWVAINEGPRMAAFEEQFLARSVERGAALFSSRCATCHGADARGNVERAPGLNNPQLFGHSFLAEIDRQIAELEEQRPALETERQGLLEEWRTATTPERRQEIQARVNEITTMLDHGLADLQDQRLNLIDSMQGAVDGGYDPEQPARLVQLAWVGTTESFIYTTLVHGRPVSSAYWPQAMPAWSQVAGGSLRNDQLQDLTNYILSFDKGEDWTLEDLLAVKQFAKVPGAETGAAVEGAVGTDVATIMTNLATITGNPAKGGAIYGGDERTIGGKRLPCASCHEGAAASAPTTAGTWSRIQSERLSLPEFAGYTPEQYVVESIVLPDNFIVTSFNDAMPNNFGDQLTVQDLADIIAYLKTQG